MDAPVAIAKASLEGRFLCLLSFAASQKKVGPGARGAGSPPRKKNTHLEIFNLSENFLN
jgi:hypothetical protein